MAQNFSYYEYKYLVTNEMLAYVRSMLQSFTGGIDPFPVGCVDSIYYDTADRRCFDACANGEGVKSKFRVRGYGDGTYGQLHYKGKLLSGVQKYKAKIKPLMLEANTPPDWDSIRPLQERDNNFNKIMSLGLQYGLLEPIVRIKYHRYRFRTFDFRMTLDTNIETYGYRHGACNTGYLVLPYHVLEVKTTKRRPKLPFMGLTKLPQVSFSKFYLGLTLLED